MEEKEVGEGFKQSLKALDGGRISIAALSLGIAKVHWTPHCTMQAADLKTKHLPTTKKAAMAKYFASEVRSAPVTKPSRSWRLWVHKRLPG